MQEKERASSSIGYEEELRRMNNKFVDVLRALDKALHEQDSLRIFANIAKFGPGYVKCEPLGVYIVTEDFFNQTF